MAKSEQTSKSIGSLAGRTLQDPNASKVQRTIAGSVLAQAGTQKVTSERVAGIEAKALSNSRSSEVTKSLAGSGLTQKTKR